MFAYDSPATRATVRTEDGRLIATPYATDGRPTESAVDFGLAAGADLDAVFDRVRFVFAVKTVTLAGADAVALLHR